MSERGKPAELCDRLKEALDICGMKPIELSKKTGIPKSMVSYYLSGRSVPKADRIFEISKVLDVSESWLMGFDVPMNRSQEAKKNDAIVGVVSKMRNDPEFFEVVSQLSELEPEEYASIKQMISLLRNK